MIQLISKETGRTRADVVIAPEGSIHLFYLFRRRAERWVADHIPSEAHRFGGALVVEWRFAGGVANGMVGDGLRVRVAGGVR